MTTLLRNKKRNSVILPLPGVREPIVFMPLGDPSGGDVALVEDHQAETAAVQNAVRTSLLEIVPQEDVDAVLARTDEVSLQIAEQAQAASMERIERVQNRDLVGTVCIGPGAREGQQCGATVIQSVEVRNGDAPPLCGKHEHLSATFYQTEVQVEGSIGADGTPEGPVTTKVWKRVEMAPRRTLT